MTRTSPAQAIAMASLLLLAAGAAHAQDATSLPVTSPTSISNALAAAAPTPLAPVARRRAAAPAQDAAADAADAPASKPAAAPAANASPVAIAIDTPTPSIPSGHLLTESSGTTEKMRIVVGQSTILRGMSPMKRVYVGNPAVLQTFNSGPEEIVVTAKAPGVSSLVIWDTKGRSCLYSVSVDVDPSGLRQSIDEAYPHNVIDVQSAENRLTVSGAVPTPEVSENVVKLAGNFSKDVVNSLRVVQVRGKQVELKLRIAEVDRTKLEQFAVNLAKSGGSNVFSTSSQQYNSVQNTSPATPTSPSVLSISNPFNLFFANIGNNLGVNLQDLESENILQVLAEPNLTTMSGQSARFLAGGEFPFPIVQGGSTSTAAVVTIQFRPYGVKVDFTPTVLEDGSIHLKIAPEVSTLDYTNAVSISGFTVPALSTRRTETEVEIKDGQSFAISGLLDHRATDSLSKLPGAADIPILGQLFRSKNLNHSTTELIIIVTATTVDPIGAPAKIALPAKPVPDLNIDKFDKKLGPARKMEEEKH